MSAEARIGQKTHRQAGRWSSSLNRQALTGWLRAGLAIVWLTSSATIYAQDGTQTPSKDVVETARQLGAQGRPDKAISLLKSSHRQNPDDERLAVALAFAYLNQDNRSWALRTIAGFLEEHPEACTARALAVWIRLQMANLDLAEELLNDAKCDTSPEQRARFGLLRAYLAEQRHDSRAVAREVENLPTERVYEEDVPLIKRLVDSHDPGRMPLFTSRVELSGGYTSNGYAGSPTDTTSGQDARGSALVVLDGQVRVVLPARRDLRPVSSLQLRAFELLTGDARDLSYEQPTFRAGILWGAEHPRLLLSYAYDAIRLHGGDRYAEGPIIYAEGNRGEWEWQVTPRLMAFGRFGARRFRDRARTRWEFEQGLASAWPLHPALQLLGALSGRWHRAEEDAYDLFGGTAVVELSWAAHPRLDVVLSLTGSADDYLHSRAYFAGSGQRRRRDLLGRGALGLWFKPVEGLQLGPSYELWDRESTAEDYAFVDQRILGRLVWSYDANRYATTEARNRPAMEWSRPHAQDSYDSSRIQELLRQDDAVKQGSSCLK